MKALVIIALVAGAYYLATHRSMPGVVNGGCPPGSINVFNFGCTPVVGAGTNGTYNVGGGTTIDPPTPAGTWDA